MSLKQSADTVAREIVENWASSEPYEWAGQSHAALQSAIADTLGRYAEALDVAMSGISSEIVRNACQSKIAIILSVTPEMEDIEVERFIVFYPDGSASGTLTRESLQGFDCKGGTAKRVSHTIQRPKVKPVVKSVSGEVTWCHAFGRAYPSGQDPNLHFENIVGKTGHMTFTWTEPAK